VLGGTKSPADFLYSHWSDWKKPESDTMEADTVHPSSYLPNQDQHHCPSRQQKRSSSTMTFPEEDPQLKKRRKIAGSFYQSEPQRVMYGYFA
jgi:hypothetical protein